ncbi:uncharacterized protein BX664DRAFT_266311, partial [Halteromyces radiatus]|uniref:uncharacterized protein n=1 Tax=Halteromyces radiatus TaxID=101107 RepID=UPI00221FA52E
IVALKRIGDHLSSQSPHHIPSPPHQPRRACVALILRWYTKRPDLISSNKLYPKTIQEFYELPWVKQDPKGELEILFMQRATRSGDRWSGHVAYIGGKNEPGETDFDTVTREVKEEIGLNLNSESFLHLGQLDDREITSIWDRKLMMILIPFVFLQVVPYTPTMQLEKDEVASVECKFYIYIYICKRFIYSLLLLLL